MRLVYSVVVVPALIAGWLWWGDRSIQHRLEPIASAIAGREVHVDCQGFVGALLDAQGREGEVWFGPDGLPADRLFLTRKQCRRLAGYAGHAFHEELACLSGLAWERGDTVASGEHCSRRTSETIFALLVLAHEAYHTAGVSSEALANCYAVQAMGYAAVELGADPREAALTARAMAALLPSQPGDYASTDCVAGSKHDLFPETPDFPTESPARPTLGRGGMRGVASGVT
jgi:hypothetical protein